MAMRAEIHEIPGRGGCGLVTCEPLTAGEVVLSELPLCRSAALPQHLLDLREETAMLVSMGYIPDWWAHALKDRRVIEACHASFEAAEASQQAAFLELADAFGIVPNVPSIFFTNNIQLPTISGCRLGDLAVYRNYSRINHSCVPNVRVALAADGVLTVVALRAVAAGEELLDDYLAGTDVASSREEQRRQLAERWRFQCACERCEREGPLATTRKSDECGGAWWD